MTKCRDCICFSLHTHIKSYLPLSPPKCLLTPSPSMKECPWPRGREGTWLHVCAKCKCPTAAQLPLYLPHSSILPATDSWTVLPCQGFLLDQTSALKTWGFTEWTLPSTCFIYYDSQYTHAKPVSSCIESLWMTVVYLWKINQFSFHSDPDIIYIWSLAGRNTNAFWYYFMQEKRSYSIACNIQ